VEKSVHNQWRRIATGLVLFGISFGYVEAAVVVYLRTIYEPLRRQLYPQLAAADLFPLMTYEQLRAKEPDRVPLVGAELAREAATLLMLAGVALVAAGNSKLWLPAFALAFGTWDLFYYVFLKVLVGWPASLLTWDILFLIPVPWAAPVLAPAIVSVSIIATGLIALRRSMRMHVFHWAGLVVGCSLVLLSFVWDSPNIIAGGLPHRFAWAVFATGELVGVSVFLHAVRRSGRTNARGY
jgi:hypothetical protein